MLIVFTVTVFLAAALMFLLQPMFARMLLPMLGGSPAVWNTAMMFYQAALLAGYALAHLASRRLNARRQALAYLGVALVALLALPVAVPRGWLPPTQTNPIPWVLGVMLVSVGLPFIVLAIASPMLQRWFAARSAKDPYWLYAASNLGSLLALIGYPALIEPRLGLAAQSRWWTAGFVLLVGLLAVCGLCSGASAKRRDDEPAAFDTNAAIPTSRKLRWLLLAFVPCSLLLSVTTFLTNAVAPIPLLWVVPLAVYLLTFVLVFAKRRLLPHKLMLWLMPLALLAMPWSLTRLLLGLPLEPLDIYVTLHVAVLFVVGMICHGELANDRPPVTQLTEFYLWLAAGGALGGMFNAVVAPCLFPTALEYPLTLVLACALLRRRAAPAQREWLGNVAWPVLLGVATAGAITWLHHHPVSRPWLQNTLMFVVPTVLCLAFFRRPIRLALCFMAVLAATVLPLWNTVQTIRLVRSFFGIHHVTNYPSRGFHHLKHGSTIHGVQSTDPERRREPLTYFSRSGPLGELMATVPPSLKQQVAVVGLGAGTVACYGEQGQQWTFFEIDPVVERIARDTRCFTFLADCPAEVKVVLGDARLSLEREPDGRFGVMILDPYNSDTPPLHLLTREALALYRRKLAPEGVMAFHISTTHLDLKSVLANLAHDARLFGLQVIDFSSGKRLARAETPSRWVVLTRHPPSVQRLNTGYWRPLSPQPAVGVWTDDYVSLFRVWSWE